MKALKVLLAICEPNGSPSIFDAKIVKLLDEFDVVGAEIEERSGCSVQLYTKKKTIHDGLFKLLFEYEYDPSPVKEAKIAKKGVFVLSVPTGHNTIYDFLEGRGHEMTEFY